MMMHYKSLQTVQHKVTPTAADLEIIRAFALAGEEVEASELFVGRMSLANDQYDRSHERFPESYLAQFAATIPGKSVMTGHDYTKDPAGRIFKAEVGMASDGKALQKDLVVSYYLLADSDLARKVRAGIAKDVSIGFQPDLRLCDLCEKDYDGWMRGAEGACTHVADGHTDYDGKLATVTYGGNVAKVEGLEGSFVWLGCQYGAQAIASMRAFSPQAKSAYFDSSGHKGIWSLTPGADIPLFPLAQTPLHSGSVAVQKEALVEVIKPAADPPPAATLTPDQERLIGFGKAFIAQQQTHVKSRYGPCGQEKTGEVIASTFETASLEMIQAAIAAADEVFNGQFPGKGEGRPLSETPAGQPEQPSRRFNPFRSAALPGRS